MNMRRALRNLLPGKIGVDRRIEEGGGEEGKRRRGMRRV